MIKRAPDIRSSEITDEGLYRSRREFLKIGSLALAGTAVPSMLVGNAEGAAASAPQAVKRGPYDTDETLTPFKDVSTYNNYYEFGADYSFPARRATNFKTSPWTVNVEGMVKKPAPYALDDLLRGLTVEDRIYRLRCVEGWSMVIAWQGVPLAAILKKLEPAPSAKFVEFKTIFAPDQMPAQKTSLLEWPYTEGLRLDEAMNPLTLIATGVYGQPLPNQNGAPLRLIVPWKYGFKGLKAIVNIRFTDQMPGSTWADRVPEEYGFYANVNPNVDHPRWTQKTERRIGQKLTLLQIARGEIPRQPTLMFNGYGEFVAGMYAGMDLTKYY